jgi:hypothetical protein
VGKRENAPERPVSPCGVFAQAVPVPPLVFFSLSHQRKRERERERERERDFFPCDAFF